MSAEQGDDDGFAGYVETTVDPGPWLNVLTALFCVISIVCFPCLVKIGRMHERKRSATRSSQLQPAAATTCDEDGENDGDGDDEDEDSSLHIDDSKKLKSWVNGKAPDIQDLIDTIVTPPYPDEDDVDIDIFHEDSGRPTGVLDTGAALRNRNAGIRRYQRGQKENKWKQEQQVEVLYEEEEAVDKIMAFRIDRCSAHSYPSDELSDPPTKNDEPPFEGDADLEKSGGGGDWRLNKSSEERSENILPEDAIDAITNPGTPPCKGKIPKEGDDFDLFYGEQALWRPSSIAAGFNRLLDVAEWDKEMKRIVSLAIPFSLSAVSIGAFETVRVALVANFIGTDGVGAYTIVLLLLGLTEEFFGGFVLTNASLCSQAVGSDNALQAGQYVQISSILFSLCMVPNILVWFFLTDDIVRLFGFNETSCQMAQDFARFFVLKNWAVGLNEAYGSFLSVIDHERFYTAMTIANEIVATSIIAGLVVSRPTTLGTVGLVELASQVFFLLLSNIISNHIGWMKDYTKGMFKTNALRNRGAVKTVLWTALPLGFGQLLQYGEWEVLTVFVAALGPAEVTTWGIVGSLWDTLETLTEGFGDAGEVRTGFLLGAGRPTDARLSAYKTLFVSVIFATLFTSLLWMMGEDLATWLTPDATLQSLIVEVLPLMGLGNIALTAGTVSWALIGAQGRYRLATLVAFVSSWFVTLPLAAIMTYGLNIDLQGTVASVVIGNSVTGTCLQYILARSDWQRLSSHIIEVNGGIESSSSSSSSVSSSSKISTSEGAK